MYGYGVGPGHRGYWGHGGFYSHRWGHRWPGRWTHRFPPFVWGHRRWW